MSVQQGRSRGCTFAHLTALNNMCNPEEQEANALIAKLADLSSFELHFTSSM